METQLAHRIVNCIIGGRSVANRHVESYNIFVREILPLIIQEHGDISVQSRILNHRHVVRFGKIHIGKPSTMEASGLRHTISPNEARKRRITYAAQVFCDIKHITYDTSDPKQLKMLAMVDHIEVPLFEIPVMVGSICCAWNQCGTPEGDIPGGGYYIVNGLEKVIVMQETRRVNFPTILTKAKSKVGNSKMVNQELTCELRALNRRKPRSTSTLFLNSKRKGGLKELDHITVQIPFVTSALSVHNTFLMLGIETEEEMRTLLYTMFTGKLSSQSARDALDRCLQKTCVSVKKNGKKVKIECKTRDDVLVFIGTHIQNAPLGSRETLLNDLRKKHISAGRSLVANEFLPHLGLRDRPMTWKRKAEYFAYLVGRLVRVTIGQYLPDDRDDSVFQMFETDGVLLSTLARTNFRRFVKTLTTAILGVMDSRRPVDLVSLLSSGAKTVTVGFQYALRTGNWGPKRGGSPHTGVAQQLAMENPVARWSHMCRAMIQYNRAGKSTQKRHLHSSSYGLLDPHETPDGERCGTIKTLANGCVIRTIDIEGDPHLRRFLRASDYLYVGKKERVENEYLVLFNGEIIGISSNPGRLAMEVRNARRVPSINYLTSVAVFHLSKEVIIDTEAGVCLRPLFVANNVTPSIIEQLLNSGTAFIGEDTLWRECLSLGIIEYISKMEERTLQIADNLKMAWENDMSHAEIDPNLLIGPAASFMVFPDHDQAARISFEGPLSKAGLGPKTIEDRMDSMGLYLNYAQYPLVSSSTSRAFPPLQVLPPGLNVIVAVLSAGWNQEDALVWNRKFFDMGGFRSHLKMTITERVVPRASDIDLVPGGTGILRKRCPGKAPTAPSLLEIATSHPPSNSKNAKLIENGPRQMFCKPIFTVTHMIRKEANYNHIDIDGMPNIGDIIQRDEIVIGKVAVAVDPKTNEPCERDASVVYRGIHPARVNRVQRTNLTDGTEFVGVELIQERRPMVGDKFTSRHAQKGVIGKIMDPEDMPWCLDGTIPDVIMNPHAFPSRMTLGHLLEMLFGKVGALSGNMMDGTAFTNKLQTAKQYDEGGGDNGNNNDDESLNLFELAGRELRRLGCEPYGCERMMCGTTGKMLEASVFIGPIYYQRLRHIALDKVQARLRGPYDHLTHQPVGGRGNTGGQRIGEMEVWTFQAHGASGFITDRLVKNSDGSSFAICQRCQTFAIWPRTPGKRLQPECPSCGLSESVRSVQMPHATYLMVRELEAMHVGIKLNIRDDTSILSVGDIRPI